MIMVELKKHIGEDSDDDSGVGIGDGIVMFVAVLLVHLVVAGLKIPHRLILVVVVLQEVQ